MGTSGGMLFVPMRHACPLPNQSRDQPSSATFLTLPSPTCSVLNSCSHLSPLQYFSSSQPKTRQTRRPNYHWQYCSALLRTRPQQRQRRRQQPHARHLCTSLKGSALSGLLTNGSPSQLPLKSAAACVLQMQASVVALHFGTILRVVLPRGK